MVHRRETIIQWWYMLWWMIWTAEMIVCMCNPDIPCMTHAEILQWEHVWGCEVALQCHDKRIYDSDNDFHSAYSNFARTLFDETTEALQNAGSISQAWGLRTTYPYTVSRMRLTRLTRHITREQTIHSPSWHRNRVYLRFFWTHVADAMSCDPPILPTVVSTVEITREIIYHHFYDVANSVRSTIDAKCNTSFLRLIRSKLITSIQWEEAKGVPVLIYRRVGRF